jgi:hypothetical protein
MKNGTFIGPCWQCKCEVWLPQELYDAAKRGADKIIFHCAYGHPAVFGKGDSELDIVRRERNWLKQQIAAKDDDIENLRNLVKAQVKTRIELETKAAKTKKRSAAGTCPCCHRTFRQMALHMRSKHPTFKAEEVA